MKNENIDLILKFLREQKVLLPTQWILQKNI